jgi:tRNA A-37 threonylcarbamoyl transferase component Bud32
LGVQKRSSRSADHFKWDAGLVTMVVGLRESFNRMCPCFRAKATGDEYVDPLVDRNKDVSPAHSVASSTMEPSFTMAELARATGNFAAQNKIGQGGFGTVYKGRLRDGRVVAIKRGKRDAYEQRLSAEFRTEVEMLSQVDHLNLGKLIGYTEEGNERILVVEYVPNGNLGEHLDGAYGKVLDMSTRLDIAIDVAHALTYLHLYADRPIIHRDIKSSNILLTDTYRAKVADFGFSRVGPSTDVGATHVSTQVKGTAGGLSEVCGFCWVFVGFCWVLLGFGWGFVWILFGFWWVFVGFLVGFC